MSAQSKGNIHGKVIINENYGKLQSVYHSLSHFLHSLCLKHSYFQFKNFAIGKRNVCKEKEYVSHKQAFIDRCLEYE